MTTQRNRFKANKVAFTIDNSGTALNMVSGGAVASSDVRAAPMPFKNPGAHQQIFISVNRNSKNQQASLAFITWLAGPEGQQALREVSGPDTLATDVPLIKDFLDANPWAPTFADLAKHSRSVMIPGHEAQTPEIMRPVMEAVESVITGGVDPRSAMTTAQQKVDSRF
jgi:multiple sugar transport system substrate-binding protein